MVFSAQAYSKANQLLPSLSSNVTSALKELAWLHYQKGKTAESLADLRGASQNGSPDDYTHFRIWAIRTLLGQTEGADEELQQYVGIRNHVFQDGWASKIGGFIAGQLTEPDLQYAAEMLDTSTAAEHHCQAYFYAAIKHFSAGDTTTATYYLDRCVGTHADQCPEFRLATAEMAKPPKAAGKPAKAPD